MNNLEKKIKSSVHVHREELKLGLQLIDTVKKEDAVFSKFFFAVLPLLQWLVQAMTACTHKDSRQLIRAEINLEMNRMKQGLLLDFIHKMNVILEGRHAFEMENCIANITKVMSRGENINNGTGAGIIVLLFKEGAKEYLPWMQKVAEARKIRKHPYVKEPDDNDDVQARSILEAILKESTSLSEQEVLNIAEEAKAAVSLFFRKIFYKQARNDSKRKGRIIGSK